MDVVIATAHGNSIEDVIHQPYFERLVRRRVFERYIFLDKGEHAGTILGDLKPRAGLVENSRNHSDPFFRNRSWVVSKHGIEGSRLEILEKLAQLLLLLKGEIRCTGATLEDAFLDAAAKMPGE